MARKSKNFGTKRIPAGSARAKEITRFIDERRAKSTRTTGSFEPVRPTLPREG